MTQKKIGHWLFGLAFVAFAHQSPAQQYPEQPIMLVAPFPAGSATDSVSRVLAQSLQEQLGKPVIVENRPGAQGTIGAAYVARAKPDGYTLLVGSSVMFVADHLYKSLSYDPSTSFQTVAGVGSTSMMFMVQNDSRFSTIQDLVKQSAAAEAPTTVAFGSPSGQIAVALLSSVAKKGIEPVAYRGIPQALVDLGGGHVQVAAVDLGNGISQIKAGKMRALAISAEKRYAVTPDVPTLAESFPGVEAAIETLIAIQAPAGTPAPIVEQLDKAIIAALASPEVKEKFAALNITAEPLNTEAVNKRIASDNPKWASLIELAGIEKQ